MSLYIRDWSEILTRLLAWVMSVVFFMTAIWMVAPDLPQEKALLFGFAASLAARLAVNAEKK